MKRVQLFNGRYTKGVPFVKNSLYKGKGLDLDRGEASPNKALLSILLTPPCPPLLPRAFHKLHANFLQLLVFRATFCIISEQFLLLVFFQFGDIWAAFSACLNWPCSHIAQCFSRQFMHFLWKRSQTLTPWGQMMGARCSRAARSEGFFNKIQNGGCRFTLDRHECLRWRRSFNNFNGS